MLCLALQEAYMNRCTIIFQNVPLHSPHICYWCPWVSWFHLREYFCLLLKPHMHCVLGHFCIWTLTIFKQWDEAAVRGQALLWSRKTAFFSILYVSARNYMISWDHSGYGMCWSKADVQLLAASVTVIFLTSWTRILSITHSILSTIHKLDSLNGYIFDACSITLRILYQLLHLSSHDLGFVYCDNILQICWDRTPWPQKLFDSMLLNIIHTTSWLTYIHYDYTSFTEHNAYQMMCVLGRVCQDFTWKMPILIPSHYFMKDMYVLEI